MDWNAVLQLETAVPADMVAQGRFDWDTLKDIFTAVAVPAALGIGWLLKRQDERRQARTTAEVTKATLTHEMQVQADRVIVETKTTDARLHEIALHAAEEASATWKEVVEYMRNVELPALRAAIASCEQRDRERAARIAHLEAVLHAHGVDCP